MLAEPVLNDSLGMLSNCTVVQLQPHAL